MEASMADRRTTSQSLKSIAGASFIALGLVILFTNLDGVAASLGNCAGILVHETVGILPALGLAALHAAQTYVFDHAGFLSSLQQICIILACDPDPYWSFVATRCFPRLLLRARRLHGFGGNRETLMSELKRNSHLEDDRRIP